MLLISFVNAIQISLLSVCAFGIVLLMGYRHYRAVCLLLALVIVASVFNLLEELNITRDLYLVTPIFVLGFGPASFLAIKGVLGDKLTFFSLCHFIPMFILLPFTSNPVFVIAVGTIWRLGYAVLSLRRLIAFHRTVLQQRSDAQELSLNWLVWSLGVITFVSMLDLVRLNFQAEISHTNNIIGQGTSTLISLIFFAILIRQLILQKDAFFALRSAIQPSLQKGSGTINRKEADSDTDTAYFINLFNALSKDIVSNLWFQIPRLTLSYLSELSGLQTRDISRAINIAANKNFNDYINQLRLEDVVKNMENDPNQPLLNLAIAAGFNSKSTFNQAFKKHYSVTPQLYRNTRMR